MFFVLFELSSSILPKRRTAQIQVGFWSGGHIHVSKCVRKLSAHDQGAYYTGLSVRKRTSASYDQSCS